MKLENQVCSLEQAEKLKELGVAQEALFYECGPKWGIMPKSSVDRNGTPPAMFTVAELGVMLGMCQFSMKDSWKEYQIGSCITIEKPFAGHCKTTTEADGRAAILIHLLESGKRTAAEVNARLLTS